jgi:hypothetical protein
MIPTAMSCFFRFQSERKLDGARLRPLRVADAAALYAYLRDSVVTELTSYPVVSVSVHAERESDMKPDGRSSADG